MGVGVGGHRLQIGRGGNYVVMLFLPLLFVKVPAKIDFFACSQLKDIRETGAELAIQPCQDIATQRFYEI